MRQRSSMDEAPFHLEVAEGPGNVRAHWILADDGLRLRSLSPEGEFDAGDGRHHRVILLCSGTPRQAHTKQQTIANGFDHRRCLA